MIDRLILPYQKKALAPLAGWLAEKGVKADQLSIAGFVIGLAALPAIATGNFLLGLLLIGLNRLFDGLDGAVARLTTPTDRGAFLDITLDFFFYATVPLAFALYDPVENALAAAILITAFVGTGSSFLAFATIAAKRGLSADAYPAKGLYYLGGLTEGAETIAIFAAMCIWPTLFPILAGLFAVLCFVTTLTRWHQGWKSFS
ncbi:CDP-alcohol phosphatidyltransferase family protein [Peteryoungia desertarenae]|uniref:CDP-alcohol phosphatidyltransferase family protein n=1 Tax=Peteryoungia desertarenae TaxID=1813451 RepID=A0ABX6QK45_9HYPH|nr:CDP-alcohol phosphatidyltransferase family protein [Peteryoungia desertarenae]QLF68931.1 CDP-alcohol phosphatidyltransferase family protein [Peteryoungia desertarenae]